MAKIKDFCTSSNSDLVKKLKTTYHLSVKQARTVIDTARRNNPALQADNITWDFLTSQPEFKDALSKYVNLEEESYFPEMKDIKDKAIADGTFMKAPNGKPTNLTEKQWLQVRTKAFKNWFGDWENNPANASKIVDENGEPLVVYHGNKDANIREFKPGKGKYSNESLYYFSDDVRTAESYATEGISEYDPNDYRIVGFNVDPNSDEAKYADFNSLEEFDKSIKSTGKVYPVFLNMKNPLFDVKPKHIHDGNLIKNTNHDGMISESFADLVHGSESKRDEAIQYVVTSSNQIKSATDNSGAFSTEDNDIYDTKAVQEDVNQSTGEEFTEEQVKEMQNRAAEVVSQNKASKLSARQIKDLLDTFKDPRRLTFLGDWMAHYAHRMVTEILANPKYREQLDIQPNATRRDVYMNISASNLIRQNILLEIESVAEINDGDKKSELNYAYNNLNTMFFLFGTQLYRWDGIGVDTNGNFFIPGAKDVESDEENNVQMQKEDGEHPTNDFSASDQNESIMTKIVPEIKSLLSDITDVDSTGTDIADSYYNGFNVYLSVPQAVNKLLVICQGCNSYKEMQQAMQKFRRGTPWISQLLGILDTETENSGFDSTNYTKSRKEQLQTQFFVSFNKQKTDFLNTYTTKDGNILTRDVGERSNARKMYASLLSKFRRHAGAAIFDNGGIRLDVVEASMKKLGGNVNEKGSILNKIKEARSKTSNMEDAYEALHYIENDILGVMRQLGLDIDRPMLNNYLDAGVSDGANDFKAFMDRTNRLAGLNKRLHSLTENLSQMEVLDNPFEKAEGEPDYMWKARKDYRTIIDMLTEYTPDSNESMYYSGSKGFYTWNNPSTVKSILNALNSPDKQKVKDYIKNKYTKDTEWFLTQNSTQENPHFYSDWLEEFYNGTGSFSVEYREKPTAFDKSYSELSDREYALSMLNDFFQRQSGDNNYALYRMIISSDKPRYAVLKAPTNDAEYILDKAQDFFSQEINRAINVLRHNVNGTDEKIKNYDPKSTKDIEAVYEKIREGKKISINDVVKDGRYIFRNSGVSFFLNKFVNDSIEAKDKLGEYVVDRIFNANSHINESLITPDMLKEFKQSYVSYIRSMAWENLNNLNNLGALDSVEYERSIHSKTVLPLLKSWHGATDDEWNLFQQQMYANTEGAIMLAKNLDDLNLQKDDKAIPYYCELLQLYADLHEFCMNNWLAKANMMEVFDIDPAFYGDTTNYQKREAQIISSGTTVDPTALLHGESVSDTKNRSITIKTDKNAVSQTIDNIEIALRKQMKTISDPMQKERFRLGMENTLNKLREMDSTDGQAFTCPTALRKRMVGRGEWSRSDNFDLDNTGYVDSNGKRNYIFTDEAVYQRMKRGYKTKEDKEALAYDLMHVFAEPQKPFVFAASNMQRDGRTITVPVQHKNSEYMLSFLTAFSVFNSDKSISDKKLSPVQAMILFMEESAEKNPKAGIDTINWDSAVKIGGNSLSIDLNGLKGHQVLEKLNSSVYNKGTNNYSNAVTEYDAQDYKIISTKPEHFRDSSQHLGSQMKILSIANLDDNAQISLRGKTVSGKEIKKRYFDALAKKTARYESEFNHDMGLDLPREDRIHRLSNTLKRLMASDNRFDVEMRHALSVTEKDGELQFNIPLDEPGLQNSIEAMLYSKIRQVYYRQATSGGIVVQATDWGASEDLNIRFFSSNPKDKDGLIPTKKEWLDSGKSESDYDAYCEKYQKGYAWFECEVPMPDYVKKMLSDKNGKIKDKYFNSDYSWNMDEIKKDVPASAFDAISYRIPTESKYSIMACKVVRFCPNDGGNIAKYPKELTSFTGSDFDIDTDFIELRPQPGASNRDVDSEIFNIQMSVLRDNGSLYETFHPGDFSDLSELSYKVKLLKEGIDPSSVSNLKDACMAVEDMDLMNPITDILLRRQNMEAKDLIGIAAVGVTSHAFFSLYGSNSQENTVRVMFRKGNKDKNIEEEGFVVDSGNGHLLAFAGGEYTTLDKLYDMDGELISLEIGKYVGASADAAKDAALYRLGINKTTLPVLIAMHRLGISGETARLFIAQPIIKSLSERIANGETKSVPDLCDEMAKDIERIGVNTKKLQEGAWDQVRFTEGRLSRNDLYNNIADPENQSGGDMLNLLHVFKTLHKISKAVNNLDSYVRYNSARAMDGSSVINRYASRRKLENLTTTLNSDKPRIKLPENINANGYYKLAKMFPYIDLAIVGEEEFTSGLMLDNMKTYGETFFYAADRLLGDNDANEREDAKALKTLYNAWKSYLLFNGQYKIADFSDEETVKKYTVDFPYHYAEAMDNLSYEKNPKFYNSVILGNSFLRSIGYVPSSTGNYDLLVTDVNGMQSEDINKYKSDWAELLNHPETRQLAIDLGIYFLARSSDYNAKTPVHLMPIAVKEAIPGYLDTFYNADKGNPEGEDFVRFMIKFQMNNSRNGKIVPQLWNINGEYYTIKNQDGELRLYFKKEKINTMKKWCDHFVDNNLATNEKEHHFSPRMPVVNVQGKLFLFTGDDLHLDGDNSYVTLDTNGEIQSLGVEKEFVEYTGLDESVFSNISNNIYQWGRSAANSFEVSTAAKDGIIGDSRFSALNAKLKDGRTIEEAYQLDFKGYRQLGYTWKQAKDDKGVHAPIKMTNDELYQGYLALWQQWAVENPNLIAELAEMAKGKTLTDKYASDKPDAISQARALSEILNNRNIQNNPEDTPIEPEQIDESTLEAISEGVVEELSEETMTELKSLFNDDGFNFTRDNLKRLIKTILNSDIAEAKENFIFGGMSQELADAFFGKIEEKLNEYNCC